MDSILELKHVSFSYNIDEDFALKNISIKISKGQHIAIIGPNGSGKSTLARIFNGILRPLSGTVYLDKKDAWKNNTIDKSVRKKIGIVFQNPDNQIVANTVEDDIAFGLENYGVDAKEMRKRVDEAMLKVGLSNFGSFEPHYLSGGQKQRLAIAGILAMKPRVIVFDEATAMLDPVGKKEILETIYQLKKEDEITIINITHSMEEAALAERVIVMDKGKILLDDIPHQIFRNRQLLKEIGLELPLTSEIAYRLKSNGYKLNRDIINSEELIKELWKLL